MPESLKDRVVLVVGASSGVGRATALMMAREGARVMASARRAERLLELRSEMAAEGRKIEVFAADVRDAAQMDRLAQATRDALGPIDIVVFSSGTNTPDRSLKRLNPAIWDELVSTNLDGAYYVTQAVLPGMRAARRGHFIFISSISGHTPDVSGAAYQASKRGLIGLSHAIRVEEKENGIRTTVINPGLIDTELLERRPVKTPAELVAVALLPEHVAEAVLACAKLPERAVITEMTVVPTAI
jgi:NADP-dependent 3-hydroxy acid dehydrogenase YdfG